MNILAREIVALEGSKMKVTTPDWVQDFPVRRRTEFNGNGKDGENGNDGLPGPQSIIIIKDK